MELPNLQVGKTQDRVAAGNTIRITASNGDVIVARAITSIRSSSVAFQRIEGQGWVAFDPSSPALTSSSKEIRRKRPRKSRIISVTEQYFFKGLVRFLNEQLYKGGDDAIVTIDDNIDTFGILGFANLGTDSSDFVAVYRKQNDLRIDLRGNKNIIGNWFLKGYSLFNRWLGTDFYGVNALLVYRLYTWTRYDYSNPRSWGYNYTVLPKYALVVDNFYDESTNIEPISEPQITATENGTITVTELGETRFPLSGVSALGPERQEGTWTYKDKYHALKQMDKNIIVESAIVSTNFGQLSQGSRKSTERMSVIFNEDYLEEVTEDIFVVESFGNYGYYLRSQLFDSRGLGQARNYQFNRKVSGVRQGTTTVEDQWYVYLDKDTIINCYARDSAEYGGDLNIVNEFRASELDDYSSLERKGALSGYNYEVQIISKGIPFGFFEQTASSSASKENTAYIVKLMLSGNECYIYSELNYSSRLIASTTHTNDTDRRVGSTFAYNPVQEETYWSYDYARGIGLSSWFLTGIMQSVNRSHPTVDYVDTIKLKNNRDDLTIEISPDSIALFIENPSVLAVGQTISAECYLPFTGLDNFGSVYERALEYSVSYSSATPSRESTMSKEMTINRLSDDTLHNQIFDNLLEREYEIIWKEIDGYYIGDVAILSYQEEDTPYYDSIDSRVLTDSDGIWEYQAGRVKRITGVTIRVNTRKKINASLLERFNLNSNETEVAVIVSRDNYYNYIVATDGFFVRPNTNIVPNLFLRENPIIATPSIPIEGDIETDRTMYAEILELLPDGRWVRREEESGDVTAMNLGSPDNTTDLWSYYKE